MKQNIENLVIAASTHRTHEFTEEGETFHQLYIWDSFKPNKPKKIDVPYTGGCHYGFNDLKIADNKLIVANTARLLTYDLNNLNKPLHEIENAHECTDMLYVTKDKLINIWQDVIQIRDLEDLENINNPILAHEFGSGKLYASIKLGKEEEMSNVLGMFPLKEDDKELVVVNLTSDNSYVIDPKRCTAERIDLTRAGYHCLPGGNFPYFPIGIDLQGIKVRDKTLILSLNESGPKCDGKNINEGYAFNNITVHSLHKEKGKYSLLEEKPINLEKMISSILIDSKNQFKILCEGVDDFEVLTYDLEKNKIIDNKKIKTQSKQLYENDRISAYLTEVNGDLKIVDPLEEIYIKSISGKHGEIILTGAKDLCPIPESSVSRIRNKFCEIGVVQPQ